MLPGYTLQTRFSLSLPLSRALAQTYNTPDLVIQVPHQKRACRLSLSLSLSSHSRLLTFFSLSLFLALTLSRSLALSRARSLS